MDVKSQQLENDCKDLTIKQRKFLEEYFRTGNGTEAAMIAYDCQDRVVAATIAYENLRKHQIFHLVQLIMESKGLTVSKLVESLMEGLSANNNDKPDYRIRLGYLQIAGKWLSLEKSQVINSREEIEGKTIQNNQSPVEVDELAEKLISHIKKIKDLYRAEGRGEKAEEFESKINEIAEGVERAESTS